MTDIISTTYTKENCTCYDSYDGDTQLAVRIVPNDGYVLKYTEIIDGETYISYASGFVLLNMNRIDELFPRYEAILRKDVPDGEYISGTTEPSETI